MGRIRMRGVGEGGARRLPLLLMALLVALAGVCVQGAAGGGAGPGAYGAAQQGGAHGHAPSRQEQREQLYEAYNMLHTLAQVSFALSRLAGWVVESGRLAGWTRASVPRGHRT
jgi:hypothetical protein